MFREAVVRCIVPILVLVVALVGCESQEMDDTATIACVQADTAALRVELAQKASEAPAFPGYDFAEFRLATPHSEVSLIVGEARNEADDVEGWMTMVFLCDAGEWRFEQFIGRIQGKSD